MTQPNATDTPPKADAPAPEAKPAENDPQNDSPLGEAGQRALDAMKAELAAAKAQVKDLTPLAQKAKELEQAQMTEVQRAQAERDEAKAAALNATTALMRLQVGSAKGLPPVLAERLAGSTVEEMTADADRLKAELSESLNAAATPRQAGSGDASKGGAPAGMDMNALLRAAAGRNP